MAAAPFSASHAQAVQITRVSATPRPRIDPVRLVVVCSLLVMMCLNLLVVGYAAVWFVGLLF